MKLLKSIWLWIVNLFKSKKAIPSLSAMESEVKRFIGKGLPYWKVWGLSKRPDSLRKQQLRCFGTFSPVKRFK